MISLPLYGSCFFWLFSSFLTGGSSVRPMSSASSMTTLSWAKDHSEDSPPSSLQHPGKWTRHRICEQRRLLCAQGTTEVRHSCLKRLNNEIHACKRDRKLPTFPDIRCPEKLNCSSSFAGISCKKFGGSFAGVFRTHISDKGRQLEVPKPGCFKPGCLHYCRRSALLRPFPKGPSRSANTTT